MLFNSNSYLIFLPLVVLAFWQLNPAGRRILLLLASYVFYAFWSVPFLALLAGSTIVNYFLGLLIGPAPHLQIPKTAPGSTPPMHKTTELDYAHPDAGIHSPPKSRRILGLILALVFNLGVLCTFKYAGFFSDTAWALFHHRPWPAVNWILPLGISFYTFEAISYAADTYLGITRPIRRFLDMALYVSFFPHLIAGPIIRPNDLVPQLAAEGELDWANIRRGVARFIWGMVKKIYVADVMAKVVNEAYSAPAAGSGASLAMATYAFAVQIFCDFSAYTDMAIGSALMLGIKLPENFDQPYLSCSIREFWRRWHISLSTWLRDYLYIPLGGSRKGSFRTYANLLITMILGGLWHGAGWLWVLWGAFHGGIMAIERAIGISDQPPKSMVWKFLRGLLTFHLICFSWILFRAHDWPSFTLIVKKIFTLAPGAMPPDYRPVFYLALIFVAEILNVKRRVIELFEQRPALARWLAYGSVAAFVLTFGRASNPEFIYFQF